ncbi:unnamed protein product [Phaedon cochleariae]|uniref:Uncharacterized protein n=1 Tax=Phaedon cochleariae TaxID=80249 RepID=A0A9P0GTE3_PHACE|nr:unnamed protein product [Phaedon cochleariae]
MANFLKIKYGPYEAHGVIDHRIQRLRGLLRCLSNLGYEIELIPVSLLNRFEIEMCDRKIFVGDITNLKFNMECEDDVVCKRAVAAVEEANSRMSVEDNIPRYDSINKGMRHVKVTENTKEIISQADLISEINV